MKINSRSVVMKIVIPAYDPETGEIKEITLETEREVSEDDEEESQ